MHNIVSFLDEWLYIPFFYVSGVLTSLMEKVAAVQVAVGLRD
ncbi:MAG: hypothetical protein WBP64_06315 [Nitrososphaeraceae archaeon]